MSALILNVAGNPSSLCERSRTLSDAGFGVLEAATGAEALEIARRRLPELILLDVSLPDIDALEVCRLIKSDPATRSTGVVHISAVAVEDNARVAGLDSGADAYIVEPATPGLLVSTLNAVIRLTRQWTIPAPRQADAARQGARSAAATADTPAHVAETALLEPGKETGGEIPESGRAGITGARAREEAEAAVGRLARLHTVMAALVEAATTDEVLDAIIGRVMAASGAETGVVALLPEDGAELIGVRVRGYNAEAAERLRRIPLDARLPIAEAVRTGEIVAVSNSLADPRFPILPELLPGNPGAAVAIPLSAGDRILGSLGIRFPKPREFAREELDVFRTIGHACAQALERARLFDLEQRARRELERSEALRRRDEQALRESEATLRFVTEVSPNNIFIQGRDLRYTWISRPIPPLKCEDYIGKTDFEVYAPAEAEELSALKRRVLSEKRAVSSEITLEMDGVAHVFDAVFEPRLDAAGEVIGLVGYLRDVTEKKQIEKRLQQAQRLESIGGLAAGIAHDFNNLLTGILGSASLLSEELENASDNVKRIVSSGERAATLTRQLLAYSGKGRFVLAKVDISETVRGMMDLLRLTVPDNVRIDYCLDGNLPAVSADPSQMQQIVMNLITNAAEAIPEGQSGCVRVETGVQTLSGPVTDAAGAEVRPGTYVRLSVTDTGVGIQPAVAARMFEPFFSTKFTGRGLGLAAVSGIVRAHKGGIMVHSEPGSGTEVRVLLPCGQDGGAQKPVVLVVDDEDYVRNFIVAALERNGYEVLSAACAGEALAAWAKAKDRIDVAIVDVLMPERGGGEVLAEIRRQQGRARVLLTSGYERRDATDLCGGWPADGYLQKPYTAETLLRAVAAVIEQPDLDSQRT